MFKTTNHTDRLHGRIECITDHGSVVLVTIDDGRQMHHLAADGNAWRRYGAAQDVHEGDSVEFMVTDWGGLSSFGLLKEHR